MTGETYPPNPYLRLEREARNWTLEDLAQELRTLMASHGDTQVGINFNSISRWERGVRRPGKRYRRYLCLLFGKRPDQLGLLPTECAEVVADPADLPDPTNGLASRTSQASPSVADGHATQRRCQEGELDALNVTRRKLLAASGLLGAAIGAEGVTETAARVVGERASIDDRAIQELHNLTVSLDRMYQYVDTELVVDPMLAHIRTLKTVLNGSLLPRQREELLRSASQSASRMSMLHFFDKHDQATGRRWLSESIAMAEATADSQLHVLGLARAACFGVYSGRAQESVQQLEQARRLADRTCTPGIRSWVFALQAEAYATLQQPQWCPELLENSASVQGDAIPEDEPAWNDGWDSSIIAGFAGAVRLRLGQPAPARIALREALATVGPSQAKSRSIYLIDLATAYAQETEIEQACDLAGKAVDIAGPMHFGLTLDRMTSLRRRLGRWQANRSVRELDERLRTLSTASA